MAEERTSASVGGWGERARRPRQRRRTSVQSALLARPRPKYRSLVEPRNGRGAGDAAPWRKTGGPSRRRVDSETAPRQRTAAWVAAFGGPFYVWCFLAFRCALSRQSRVTNVCMDFNLDALKNLDPFSAKPLAPPMSRCVSSVALVETNFSAGPSLAWPRGAHRHHRPGPGRRRGLRGSHGRLLECFGRVRCPRVAA